MIHYITSWARQPQKHNLRQFPAAATKSEYVTEALKGIGGNQTVRVLSLAQTLHRKWYWAPRTVEVFDEKETDEVIPSIGSPIRLVRGLNRVILNVYLLCYLLFRVKKDDAVIMYHSYSYATAMIIAHKLRKLKYILEVEEIYQDVVNLPKRLQRAEYNVFKRASAYVFSSSLLNTAINIDRKDASISHGTYKVEQNRNIEFNDGKIHVVYAGTLNPKKGGAKAAASVEVLPENYHVHILGYGSASQINDMKNFVAEIAKKSKAKVSYDGLLSGEDYIRFIQSCHIGLSTQNPDAAFNATSFPSKILSYMANGLRVVSVRIPAIEQSAVGDLITYYDEQTPEAIAKAITDVDMSEPYDSRARIAELDAQFRDDLKKLIEANRA